MVIKAALGPGAGSQEHIEKAGQERRHPASLDSAEDEILDIGIWILKQSLNGHCLAVGRGYVFLANCTND